MKILILTERFFPEEFLINDLAAEWRSAGQEVEVLTQVPSYPGDRIFSGYRNRLFQTTREFHEIPVHRVRTVLGYNTGGVKRKIVNYLSFAFWTSLWALANGWRCDQVFAYHTGPLSMASAGMIFRFVWWRKCMIWTQDVWPDTVYSYGIRPTLPMRLFLNLVVRSIYTAFRTITVSCPGFVGKLKPYTRKKVVFLPQWTTHDTPLPPRRADGKKIFTFAGNIGSVQNLDKVIDAFGKRNRADAELRIVGGGIYLDRLQKQAVDNGFRNIVFTGRRPSEEMPEYFAESDVLIISLKPEFDLTIPAKFQAYIAAGRPILGLVRGDTADLIRQHDLGLVADPADEAAIGRAFDAMCEAPAARFADWREHALALSRDEFSREKTIRNMTNLLVH